jgi:hypothetical protein
VRRVQPNVIPLVERGFLTDKSRDEASTFRFTTGRARHLPPKQLGAREDLGDGNAQ